MKEKNKSELTFQEICLLLSKKTEELLSLIQIKADTSAIQEKATEIEEIRVVLERKKEEKR
jgi:hypothetical protein